jgi:hypothetical protein
MQSALVLLGQLEPVKVMMLDLNGPKSREMRVVWLAYSSQ